MEVKMCADGPCLVEVGSRCHGGEGTWLPVVQECIGYSQLDATLNCYLRPDRFDALPFEPHLLKQGVEAFLVSRTSGLLLVSRKITSKIPHKKEKKKCEKLVNNFLTFTTLSINYSLIYHRTFLALTQFAVCSHSEGWRCSHNRVKIYPIRLTVSPDLVVCNWSIIH